MDTICVLDLKAEGIGRVWVFEHGQTPRHLRYSVLKIMRLQNGKTARKTKYYERKAAAVRYAKKWIGERTAGFFFEVLKGGAQ